jgi:hypothetical protein
LGDLERVRYEYPRSLIYGDYPLGILNHLSFQSLLKLGLTGATLSLEADNESATSLLRGNTEGKILCYLTGRPAVFTSRGAVGTLSRGPVLSPRGEKFTPIKTGKLFQLIPEKRFFMGPFLKMPINPSVNYLLDLRYEKNPEDILNKLRNSLFRGHPLHGPQFNFKGGLK